MVSASFQTGKNSQKSAKLLSQNLVQGCVKTWSKYVAQQNWTKFWRKKSVFFLFFFGSFFFKISFSLQKEEDFWKQKKKKKRKIGPSFDSKKGYFWTKFWLYSIYIYIYLSLSWAVQFLQSSEEDKRATTNAQNGLVLFFFFSFILFSSLWAKTVVKPLNSKKKSWRISSKKKTLKMCDSVWKSAKKCGKVPRRFCPLVVGL